MFSLTEEMRNNEWVSFCDNLQKSGLYGVFEDYGLEKLKDEVMSSPCGIREESGTAHHGALAVHVDKTITVIERLLPLVRGTLNIEPAVAAKICVLMHLPKRYMFEPNDNDWEINVARKPFKFREDLEGVLTVGDRAIMDAMLMGITVSPIEAEAIKTMDKENEPDNNPYKSILTLLVRQANEIAYAIERERFKKFLKR